MKSLFFIIVFLFSQPLIAELRHESINHDKDGPIDSDIKGEKVLRHMGEELKYKWEIRSNRMNLEMYLNVSVESISSNDLLCKRRYILERLIICKNVPREEDDCTGTGVRVEKVPFYPNPVILLKAIKGAHSQILKIYDLHKDIVTPVAEYVGSYFVDFEIGEKNIEIIYDEYCEKPYPCEQKVKWPEQIK